jgi:hypothetical protein
MPKDRKIYETENRINETDKISSPRPTPSPSPGTKPPVSRSTTYLRQFGKPPVPVSEFSHFGISVPLDPEELKVVMAPDGIGIRDLLYDKREDFNRFIKACRTTRHLDSFDVRQAFLNKFLTGDPLNPIPNFQRYDGKCPYIIWFWICVCNHIKSYKAKASSPTEAPSKSPILPGEEPEAPASASEPGQEMEEVEIPLWEGQDPPTSSPELPKAEAQPPAEPDWSWYDPHPGDSPGIAQWRREWGAKRRAELDEKKND